MPNKYSDVKMNSFRTAYSPMYDKYVGIRSVYKDVDGKFIIKCHVADTPQSDHVLFRENELIKFSL